MIPTNDSIDKKMAAVLGWKYKCLRELDGTRYCWHNAATGAWSVDCPRFCSDRNLLPQVWAAIGAAGQWGKYFEYLDILYSQTTGDYLYSRRQESIWYATCPPRLVVIAALRALDAWPAEWGVETEVEGVMEEVEKPE